MNTTQIAIYGGGGFGREMAWLVALCSEAERKYQVVCFIDDDRGHQDQAINNIPVMGLSQVRNLFPQARVVGAVGNPGIRQKLVEKAAAAGFGFETVIHPRVELSPWLEIGTGSVICAGCSLTTDIVIGQHVQINLNCTLTHDDILEDFATLAPGVNVSGNVHIGKRAYIGSGAVIINGTENSPLVIGQDAVVGAGACVTRSVAPGLTVVGVPARPLRQPLSGT